MSSESKSLVVVKCSPLAKIPQRATPDAAGYDICSIEDTKVPPRGKALIKTGLKVQLPAGTYGRLAPRSGLTWKNSIDVGAGVIDRDYRGEVGVILFNHSDVPFVVNVGDRIAQLILECIVTPLVVEQSELTDTERGGGGFGSTGIVSVYSPGKRKTQQ